LKTKSEDKYSGIYKGIGKLKNKTVKLHINPNVKPVAQRNRKTPFHLREKVEKENKTLLENDIIEEVNNEPTSWVSPIVTPPKQNGDVRVCVDMREANKAMEWERHQMPTIDELIHDMNGAKIFSKLDLKAGYNQLVLQEESRYITTFATHMGLYLYKRLNFWTKSASKVFQKTISEVIQGKEGSKNISNTHTRRQDGGLCISNFITSGNEIQSERTRSSVFGMVMQTFCNLSKGSTNIHVHYRLHAFN
jgi:hypothetical protein